ncbi:GDP-mannose 4,6-dehydratase [Thalassoglobus polymorphus]|uniref:GDP-mannose 4,6-dehydratase n=2 Tax=Thalassoglobus polymorphus TaxID=2527994 RepID=A0A517QLM9_9PLAN|nr:GDP-mannose 4,6-dehydratase [Thalassoglobus polymorphus]
MVNLNRIPDSRQNPGEMQSPKSSAPLALQFYFMSQTANVKTTSQPRKKKALITGITGQDGAYLAEFLLQKNYEVWGMHRRVSSPTTQRIDHLLSDQSGAGNQVRLEYGDLSDASSLSRIIDKVHPSEVYNLAAQSDVKASFDLPEYTGDVTGLGTLRLLEAIRNFAPNARFYQASSSELFGLAKETPQTETTPFHPRSPYGVAKSYAFQITQNYRESYGMFAVNGILFNHESPRRGEKFVTRKITRGLGRILAGTQESLSLGNLDAKRDWGFAGDYVDAMWRMLQTDDPEDYVIATGATHTVRDFCNVAFTYAGLPITWKGTGVEETGYGPEGQVLIRINPEYFRPSEVDLLLGDATKAKKELDWTPQVSFQELVEMMVDHDRELAISETK